MVVLTTLAESAGKGATNLKERKPPHSAETLQTEKNFNN